MKWIWGPKRAGLDWTCHKPWNSRQKTTRTLNGLALLCSYSFLPAVAGCMSCSEYYTSLLQHHVNSLYELVNSGIELTELQDHTRNQCPTVQTQLIYSLNTKIAVVHCVCSARTKVFENLEFSPKRQDVSLFTEYLCLQLFCWHTTPLPLQECLTNV